MPSMGGRMGGSRTVTGFSPPIVLVGSERRSELNQRSLSSPGYTDSYFLLSIEVPRS